MSEPAREIVFYDGECGLCHRAVRFLIARDRRGRLFAFAPIGGSTFTGCIDEKLRRTLPDSIAVLSPTGRLLVRSDAVLHLLQSLGARWRLLARVTGILPSSLLDRAYDLVASIRFHVFARPHETCPVGSPELRDRFLP